MKTTHSVLITSIISIWGVITLLSFSIGAQPIQPEVLATFYGTNGSAPWAGLTQAGDGNFYGTTRGGGTNLNPFGNGYGTVFQITAGGTLTTLVHFNSTNGADPRAALTLGNDGALYGTTISGGGGGDYGTVFKVTTEGVFTKLVSFNNANGAYPSGLALGNDGTFYGTTANGGGGGDFGMVFRVTTNGILTKLVSFNNANGAHPMAGLVIGPDGNFYGTTAYGGSSSDPSQAGTVFRVTTNGTLTTLASFSGANGSQPQAALTLGNDGDLYGTTWNYYGTVFKVTTNGVLTTLHRFDGNNGGFPEGGLTLGNDGNFYGTTFGIVGGDHGTVFQVTTNGILATLVAFNNANGASPAASLTLGNDGYYYATTYEGGGYGAQGTVFRLRPEAPVIFSQPQPSNQVVPAGVSVTFSASVFGAAPLTYQWRFNGTELPGAINPWLTLTNVVLSLSGNYSLVAINPLGGPVFSSDAELVVLPALVTTLPVSSISATSAMLNGSVVVGPHETLAWFEWGADTNYGEIDGITDIPGGSGTVTFSNALSGLNGEIIYHHRVVAQNSFGLVYGSDQTFQVGLQPTAVTLAVSGLAADTMALNAISNPGGRQTTVWFQWGTSTNYGAVTPPTNIGSGSAPSNFTSVITGLLTNTIYHYCVVASNSLAIAIGSDLSFLIGAPLAVTGPFAAITDGNASIKGSVTPNSLPTTAWFEWGTNTGYGNTVFLGNVGGGNLAVSVSNVLSGLDSASTYHYRMMASNSAGNSAGADAQIGSALYAHEQSVLADQPLVYYRFDETNGRTLLNYGTAGAAGNGTYGATVSLGNPGLVPSFGYAAGFNNSNSSVVVPAFGTFSNLTFEVWAKPLSLTRYYNSIYTTDVYASGALHTHFIIPGPFWQVAIAPSDHDIEFGGDPGRFLTNSWVHLSATHESAGHRTIAYINGRAVFTNNLSTSVPINLTAAHIGTWVGAQNWFHGLLDEFAIYTNVLLANRIQEHYQTAIGNPVLSSSRATNRLTFSWAGPGFRLQSNTNLSNPAGWTIVPAGSNSPVSVTISNSGRRFFRLMWP